VPSFAFYPRCADRHLRNSRQRSADERHRGAHLSGDERCRDAHHAVARAAQLRVPLLIEVRTPLVIAAIHFDDQVHGRSAEISHEAPDDDLPPKRNAETAATQLIPQERLRRCGLPAHALSATLELMMALRPLTTLIGLAVARAGGVGTPLGGAARRDKAAPQRGLFISPGHAQRALRARAWPWGSIARPQRR